MQHIFIINPTAGKVDASVALIPQIHAAASRAGLHPTIEVTRRAGQARDLAAQYAAGGEEVYLYACGGDGTLNEVAAGAAGRGVRRALAGFPAQGLPGQLAVLTVGGTVTVLVFLLAALPLGLWEELRAVLRQAKTGKNRGK